jgi:hypothetical protein
MKSILELNNDELKEFFLKEESCINFDLPLYYSLLERITLFLISCNHSSISSFLNLHLLTRDGRYFEKGFDIYFHYIYYYIILNNKERKYSSAAHYLEAGINLRYIQELLGHKDSKKTEIYTHVSKKDLGKIVSPLDRMKERDEIDKDK